MNPNITIEYVTKHIELDWNWRGLSRNLGISYQDIIEHSSWPWNWTVVYQRPDVPWPNVVKQLGLLCDFWSVSSNTSLTIDIVLRHCHEDWNWVHLSRNPVITFQHVQDYPELESRWSWLGLSQNPNVTEEIIVQYFEKWWWNHLCANKAVTMDIVHRNPSWPWYGKSLCNNPNITMEYIRGYRDHYRGYPVLDHDAIARSINIREYTKYYPMDTFAMSANPTLRLSDVTGDSWDYGSLARNAFALDYHDMCRQHMAAYKIQLYWRLCSQNISYTMCHKLQYERACRY